MDADVERNRNSLRRTSEAYDAEQDDLIRLLIYHLANEGDMGGNATLGQTWPPEEPR